ncbi:MAG: hypothetical protein IKA82_00835 [Clostridia bacterium]|nr:hypothetical protein [Clostridia bacterium]
MDGSRIILAAHRGDKFRYPENTALAFQAAIDLGVDMIETDIHMTRDGELVIIHDRSAKRTTGVDRFIDEMTLAEVKELDAGCMFEPKMPSKILTVREFIELIKDTDMLVNWELKTYPKYIGHERAFEAADKLIALIEEYGMEKRSMLNSFSAQVLEHIYKKYGKKYPIHGQGINNCRKSCDTAEVDERELFDWCCMYANVKGKLAIEFRENFDYCLENGVIPCVCMPDTIEGYKIAIDYGCKMFTSNNISEADKVLRALGVR